MDGMRKRYNKAQSQKILIQHIKKVILTLTLLIKQHKEQVKDYRRRDILVNSPNLSQFLTEFGLNLLSQSPTGNIFQTAAKAAKEPFQRLQAKRAML